MLDLDMRQAAVYYLLQVLGRPALRTEVVKLMFLVDLELVRRGRRPLFRWVRWFYGPFSREVLDALDVLEELELVDVERDVDVWSLTIRRVEYRVAQHIDVSYLVDEELRSVIESVAEKWRDRNLEDLVSYVYELPQVRGKRLGEVIELER